MKGYINKLLTNNSGVSIKSWIAFVVASVGIAMLVSLTAVLWIDVLTNKELKTTLQYYSDVIVAISALIFSGALPKIVGEFKEKLNDKKE
jgi:hypothetical protein